MNTNLTGPFGEIKVASSATGNAITASASTAAAAYVAFPVGTQYAWIEGRNYATAVVVQYSLNPYLAVVKTTDALATGANATDYSDAAQDGNAATDVVLSSLATTHALWIGSHLPFRGVFADVDAANGNAATVVATYWSTGATMAALAGLADGTANGGATFGQDGAITWTVPTDWAAGTLRSIAAAANAVPYSGESLYWVKLTVGAALDSSTTLDQLLAMGRASAYDSLTSGRVREMVIHRGLRGAGCIEAKVDAGTANLLVTVATLGIQSKFP